MVFLSSPHYSNYRSYCQVSNRIDQQGFLLDFSRKRVQLQISRQPIYNHTQNLISMGWKWWNKGNDENSSQQDSSYHQKGSVQPAYETKTFFRSYSSSRSCRPDPEDSNYLICTEKVQDGNDRFENVERVPVNQNSSFSNGLFDFNRKDPWAKDNFHNKNQFDDFDRAMQDFMTPFFHFPSFFGHNHSQDFNRSNDFFPSHNQYQSDQRGSSPRGQNDYSSRGQNAYQPRGGGSYDSYQRRQSGNDGRNGQKCYFSSQNRDFDIKDI